MKRSKKIIIGLFAVVFALSACAGLPGSNNEDEIEYPLGPQISLTEHQTQVFEDAWKRIQRNYVYFDTSDRDFESLHEKYLKKIETGLTAEAFNEMMTEFAGEFPVGEIIHQTREERIENDISPTATYGGIGAFVGYLDEPTPHIVILDVMADSPAEKAGIHAHDSIIAVDGDPILAEEGIGAISRVRGLAGTDVLLTVKSPDKGERDVNVTRGQISGNVEIKSQLIPETTIGYILLPTSASNSSVEEIVAEFTKLSSETELSGLIIDLRVSRSAQDDWPLDAMLALFQNGTIGEIFNRAESQSIVIEGQDIAGSQNIPLAVLVGEHTSGFPEIFAASIQESGRGIAIGSNTPGNFESLNGFLLPDGSNIYIASSSFRLEGNPLLGTNGLQPKVQVEARWDQVTATDDPVLQAAIQSFKEEVEQ